MVDRLSDALCEELDSSIRLSFMDGELVGDVRRDCSLYIVIFETSGGLRLLFLLFKAIHDSLNDRFNFSLFELLLLGLDIVTSFKKSNWAS